MRAFIIAALLTFALVAGVHSQITNSPRPASNVAYDESSWDGNMDPATKNAIRDQIETMVVGAAGVSSFNTLTGAVTISAGANITLTPVGNDIEISTSATVPTTFGDITTGTNTTATMTMGTGGSLVATGSGIIDATRFLGVTTVDATEFGYLNNVTSALQTQLNAKSPLASPTFTGTVTIPTPFTLGAVSVLPTGTELNFVDGVTSSIQTQLNAKAALASPTFTGTVTIPTPFTLGAVSVLPTGTELNFVDGVTSSIQTQLNAKAALANPVFTGTVTIPTPFTLGGVSVLPTGTELNFVDGVTSSIQTQLNSRVRLIASGTSVLNPTEIAAGACATVITTAASGVASTDVLKVSFNGSVKAVVGYRPQDSVTIQPYPSINNVNYDICNKGSSAVDPGSITVNFQVERQ